MNPSSEKTALRYPPVLKGALPLLGHILDFGKNPHLFMMRLRDRFGDVAEFKMFHQPMVLLTGDKASEAFYRAADEVLDQGAAYKIMTPIFGHGVVFDAPIKVKNQQLQMLMPALRDKPMRSYSDLIVEEVTGLIGGWGSKGEIDLLDFMKELTIYTSSHCLLGPEFRHELNREFAEIYHDLEQAIQPIAYVFPNLPLPVFRRRDRARKRLQGLVTEIMARRSKTTSDSPNVFQTLIDASYEDGTKLTPHEITGMLIATIFAGHHTSSGTASWVLIELLRHPEWMSRVVAEIDEVFGDGIPVTYEALRKVPVLESVLKEVLRLHPPLIILMRKVLQDFSIGDITIPAGKFVCAAPAITHRIPELFPEPERFDPERYSPERQEDKNLYAWQAFGGGRHKCSGNAFALFQIKAIFCVLLRDYAFELVGSPESYQDDYTKMVVEPGSPARVRFQKRKKSQSIPEAGGPGGKPLGSVQCAAGRPLRIIVDMDLCKGHGTCVSEAPDHFKLDARGQLDVLKLYPDETEREQINAAVRHCPTQAIKLVEGGD